MTWATQNVAWVTQKNVARFLKNQYIIHMNSRAFWSRVKTLLKAKAVTQKEAAKACGLSSDRFRTWMSRGMIPPLSSAFRLSRHLGVSLEYLIRGQGTDKASQINEEVLALLKTAGEKLSEVRRSVP